MKTRTIKVVKRNKNVVTDNTQTVAESLRSDGSKQKIVQTLNHWIAERRANESAKRANFNNQLLEWKTA